MRAAAGAVALGVLLTGCTSGGPRFDVDDLAAGACAEAGPALLSVETTQQAVADGELEPADAAADYEQVQNDLLAARESADPEVADPLRALVTSLGLCRSGAGVGTTSDVQREQLRGDLDDVLVACGVTPDGG